MGHPLIMGRKTFESIGKPLPGRRCVVLTRQIDYQADGCTVAASIGEALSLFHESEELFVAGGSEIYRQTLPLAQRLYISFIDLDCDGDAGFPEIPESNFFEVSRETLSVDPPCTLVIYERQSADCGTF
jgi:dihydrofolate reductase